MERSAGLLASLLAAGCTSGPKPVDVVVVDAGTFDAGPRDAGARPDAGRTTRVLVRDATDPDDVTYFCDDGAVVRTGTRAAALEACAGAPRAACPETLGLPSPGALDCLDPGTLPSFPEALCVLEFFACHQASGACAVTRTGSTAHFRWGSRAQSFVAFDPAGQLETAAYFGPDQDDPCILGGPLGPSVERYERF